MSWADAQPAFASGAVDGQENPIAVYQAAKLHTVAQKHITMWGYVNDPLVFRGEQGHLEQLDTRRPRDREASRP